jgi:hypothetical protein
LLAVASLVLENGGDEEQAIAGLLHDGPEDQGGVEVLVEIRRRFGDRVADMVAECSDTFETPKPPWRDRKESYIRHLREASTGTFLVSAADKVHNLGCILRDYRNIGESLWDRFKASRTETIWYYTTLTETYENYGPQEVQLLASELRLLLGELNTLVKLRASKTYPCPVPGCSKVFLGSRGGWDGHVGSLQNHPEWEPGLVEARDRRERFRVEFADWFA